jgi:hypothetical protein
LVADGFAKERRGHDADDRHNAAAERHRTAERVRLAAKPALPVLVADNGIRRGPLGRL